MSLPVLSTSEPTAMFPADADKPHRDWWSWQDILCLFAWNTPVVGMDNGLLFYVLDDADASAYSHSTPESAAADTAAFITIRPVKPITYTAPSTAEYKVNIMEYTDQQAKIHSLNLWVRAHLSAAVKAALDPQFGDCRHLSAKDIVKALRTKYGSPTLTVLEKEMDGFDVPLKDPSISGVDAFLALWHASFRYLEAHGFKPPEPVLVSKLLIAFSAPLLPSGDRCFQNAMDAYHLAHPLLTDHNFGTLSTALIKFTAMRRFPAPSALAPTIDSLYGHTVVIKAKRGPRGEVRPSRERTTFAPHVERPPQVQVWCCTHGWTGHTSEDCDHPAPGHVRAQTGPTAANPAGLTGCYRHGN
jgi:hypothetical protein